MKYCIYILFALISLSMNLWAEKEVVYELSLGSGFRQDSITQNGYVLGIVPQQLNCRSSSINIFQTTLEGCINWGNVYVRGLFGYGYIGAAHLAAVGIYPPPGSAQNVQQYTGINRRTTALFDLTSPGGTIVVDNGAHSGKTWDLEVAIGFPLQVASWCTLEPEAGYTFKEINIVNGTDTVMTAITAGLNAVFQWERWTLTPKVAAYFLGSRYEMIAITNGPGTPATYINTPLKKGSVTGYKTELDCAYAFSKRWSLGFAGQWWALYTPHRNAFIGLSDVWNVRTLWHSYQGQLFAQYTF